MRDRRGVDEGRHMRSITGTASTLRFNLSLCAAYAPDLLLQVLFFVFFESRGPRRVSKRSTPSSSIWIDRGSNMRVSRLNEESE